MPRPSKYINRIVRIGKLVVMCEGCVRVLGRGKSRGKYKLEGISAADCQVCGRRVRYAKGYGGLFSM